MFSEWFIEYNTQTQITLGIVGILTTILFFNKICKIIIKRALSKLLHSRDNIIYTFLKDEKLIFWILSLPNLMIVHMGAQWTPGIPENILKLLDRVVYPCYIFLGLFILSHFLRIINEIYSCTELSNTRPIKGYLQSIQIISFVFGITFALAIILNRSPLMFISGLGAMTAVLLLVFKETILSFVAGVQLTTNDLIRVGDWVEMPQFNADGNVIEIALNTVKIQNWDKTITVIPAHQFLAHSFKNWRGMVDSGGRRIKRSINIDLNTIRFLNRDDIQKLSKIQILKNYIQTKTSEIDSYNNTLLPEDSAHNANAKKLTNVGTFRAYVTEYLKHNPCIHKDMTFLVRQLAPGPEGLPIEIYVFTNDTRWAFYESIQSDIFDHLYAILSEFDLHSFQQPSGQDLKIFKSLSNTHYSLSQSL